MNVSISNTCNTADSANGRQPGVIVGNGNCYTEAKRPGCVNTRMLSCVPLLVRRYSGERGRRVTALPSVLISKFFSSAQFSTFKIVAAGYSETPFILYPIITHNNSNYIFLQYIRYKGNATTSFREVTHSDSIIP